MSLRSTEEDILALLEKAACFLSASSEGVVDHLVGQAVHEGESQSVRSVDNNGRAVLGGQGQEDTGSEEVSEDSQE